MTSLNGLDALLEFMELNIDSDIIRHSEKLQYDAIKFGDVDYLPLSLCAEPEGFPRMPHEAIFRNPDAILYNELVGDSMHSPLNTIIFKDDSVPVISCGDGGVIIAALLGCKTYFHKKNSFWVQGVDRDEAKRILSNGIPDMTTGIAADIIETYQYFNDKLSSFDRCRNSIRISQPDLLGPYEIFQLILGDDAYILPYENPEFTKSFIDLITETYTEFLDRITPLLNNKANNDASFIKGFCINGNVLINTDTAVTNLSQDMYRLYEGRPNAKIIGHYGNLGGGSLHYCGDFKEWNAHEIVQSGMGSVNFGNPELHDLGKVYPYFKQNGISISGWGKGQDYDFIKKSLALADNTEPIKTGITLTCCINDHDDAPKVLEQHRNQTIKS